MPSPSRIMFIRHAEKPIAEENGVNRHGAENEECLSVRGWLRAGALARFFCPYQGSTAMKPNAIYAAGIGTHSPSHRPKETVKPLVELLDEEATFNDRYPKSNGKGMLADVLQQTGIVLIAWEHTLIPGLVEHLVSSSQNVPRQWPDDRFDIVWILDFENGSWVFSQMPQMLLAGDRDAPIS